MLTRIAERIERSGGAGYAEAADLRDVRQKMVRSAVVMADELQAKGNQVVIISDILARDKLINAVPMRLVE